MDFSLFVTEIKNKFVYKIYFFSPSENICAPEKFELKSCKTGNLLWEGYNKLENGACKASWQSSGANTNTFNPVEEMFQKLLHER